MLLALLADFFFAWAFPFGSWALFFGWLTFAFALAFGLLFGLDFAFAVGKELLPAFPNLILIQNKLPMVALWVPNAASEKKKFLSICLGHLGPEHLVPPQLFPI